MTRRTVLAAALTTAVFGLLWVLVAVRWGPLMRLDRNVDARFNGYAARHHAQTTAWRLLSDIGGPAVLRIALVLAGVVLFLYRRVRAAVLCVAVVLGSLVVVTLVKDIVNRPRPVVAHSVASSPGASFPSGHAFTAAAAAFVVVALTTGLPARSRIAVRVVALVVAALIGISRLVLGVHFPSDVLAGWVGAAALVLALHAGSASPRFPWGSSADRQDLGRERAARPWRVRQRRADP